MSQERLQRRPFAIGNVIGLLFPMLVLITTTNIAVAQDKARALASGAFYSMEETPFDREVLRKAIEDIKFAEKLNSKEPWVAIATSRAFLEMGYEKGDRYNIASYEAEKIEKAEYYGKQGILLGPNESVAYFQLARLQIILRNYSGALDTLNHADQKEKNQFYSSFLRAVISIRVNNKARASAMLDEADQRADHLYQRRAVLQERVYFARLLRDSKLEESYYKKMIELEPRNAHAYGNYGGFLLSQKRYDEAIEILEQAISISSYPLANDMLRRAQLLRNATTK